MENGNLSVNVRILEENNHENNSTLCNADEIISEINDRKKREFNIILFNVPLSSDRTKEDRIKEPKIS